MGFHEVNSFGILLNRFWQFVWLQFGCMSNNFISTGNGDAFIDKETNFVEIFNIYYINIVEKTSGVPHEKNVIDTNNTQEIIEGIIRKYERHPSMLKMKNNFDSLLIFLKLKLPILIPFSSKESLKNELELTLFPKN